MKIRLVWSDGTIGEYEAHERSMSALEALLNASSFITLYARKPTGSNTYTRTRIIVATRRIAAVHEGWDE